jgi:hypothetical protein
VREVSRDVVGFESFSVSMDKERWFIKSPRWKDDIVDRVTAYLLLAEIVVILTSACILI